MSLRLAGVVVMTLASVACGPVVGGSCRVPDRYDCATRDTALECRTAKWREVPCRGPTGCQNLGGHVFCDVSGDKAGDACGLGSEGTGICTEDSHATLECRDGTWVKTNDCPTGCTSDGAHLSCR